ncbi:MAG: chemotaxis protein CheV [Candidatus Latescibacteria bacterium]|nr:chemotaxis protein CheV [Candidatus Latescibacterota bacterium]
MNAQQEPIKIESNLIELIDFRLFEQREDGSVYEGIYGLNVSKVREIIILPRLSRVPEAHPAIEGLFNLRGVEVPAVNLATWLKIREAPPQNTSRKAIVTEFSHQTVGLIIHQAHRIRRVSWDSIKPPPSLISQRHGASIIGTTLIDENQTLLMIDVEKIAAEIRGQPLEEVVDSMLIDPVQQHQGRVLIVDDSAVARKQLSHMLTRAGFRVVEASDGQDAIDKMVRLRAQAPGHQLKAELQMVITDVEMPRMDGYLLTSRIKSDPQLRDLPVIMHSSLSGQANIDKGRQSGCDEYLVKLDPQTLLDTISRYIH